MKDTEILQSIDSKLTALIALLSISINPVKDGSETRPEIVLKQSGLDVASIAQILRKNPDAVRKTIQRAKNN